MLSVDEVTKKIQEFQNMHRDKNYHFHNTYYMYTEDMDGNITGEAYGINFMTNYGFNRLCSSEYINKVSDASNAQYFNRINGRPIFGTGTGPLTFNEPASEIPAMQELFATPSYSTALNVVSTEYDTNKHVIYETDYMGYGVLDYNISGVTTDTNITEVGIGYDATHLYFHFLIRDKNGDISPIVKRPNEKLTIYVYNTFCVHENVMLNRLPYNEYILTNPSAFFNAIAYYDDATNYYNKGFDTCALMNNRTYTYMHDTYDFTYSDWATALTGNRRKIRPCISNNSIYTNNECEYDVRMTNSILLENKEAYIGFTIYCGVRLQPYVDLQRDMPFMRNATGWSDMFIFKFDKQTTSEEIVCEDIYTNDMSTNRIQYQYGYKRDNSTKVGAISAVDYKIQSMKMFNVQDNDFTINESFLQNDNYQDFYWFHARCPYYNFVCPDGIKRTILASVNPWTNMKIKKFTNTGITIFAADKAWDHTTWTQIPNIADVPDELSHSRYYVSYSNECLSYEFQDQYYPRISPKTQVVKYDTNYDHDLSGSETYYDSNNDCGYIVGTDEYNWFAIGKTIFMMNDDNTINTRYNIGTLDLLDWYNRFAYKDLFLTTGRDSTNNSIVRLCRINNDHTVSEYIMPRAFSKDCSCSWSDTGSCKNGRFVVCETDATSGIMVYDMEILANTTGTQLYKEYSNTDQQAILNDFYNGTINDSTGQNNTPVTDMSAQGHWTSTNDFIELPDTFDISTQKIYIRIVGLANNTVSYRNLWVKFYFYGENDEYLGYVYRKSSPSNYTNQTNNDGVLSGIRKIKISLHVGYDSDPWYEEYCLRPNKIQSLKISVCITTPVTDGVYHIPGAYHGICMKDVNKLIYTKHDDEYIKSWYIQDLEHLDTPPTKISLEDGQYGNSYSDGMGFSHYVYIRINDLNNIYSTWMYDLDTQQWTHLVDWDYTMSKAVTCGNDKCIVFSGAFSYHKYIITADEPTVCREISSAKWGSTTMKYINNGKQLVLSSNVVTRYKDYSYSGENYNYCYPRTYDLGLWLRDKKWINGEPRLRFGNANNEHWDLSYKGFNYPYKNGVITLAPKTTSQNGWTLYYYPIEYYLPHKTVGTTTTITAYNNPIRITGKGYKFTRTNDMSKLGLDNK